MYKIWGQPNCVYCDRAKALLTKNSLEFEYKELGTNATKQELFDVLPSARSVPQIFFKDKHIGGYNELVKHLDQI